MSKMEAVFFGGGLPFVGWSFCTYSLIVQYKCVLRFPKLSGLARGCSSAQYEVCGPVTHAMMTTGQQAMLQHVLPQSPWSVCTIHSIP